MKPRSLKSALESGYRIARVYEGGKQVRLTLEQKNHRAGRPALFQIWINRAYIVRNYPNVI